MQHSGTDMNGIGWEMKEGKGFAYRRKSIPMCFVPRHPIPSSKWHTSGLSALRGGASLGRGRGRRPRDLDARVCEPPTESLLSLQCRLRCNPCRLCCSL